MPKRRTKSKHVEDVKAKSEDSKGKSRNVRVTKAKSKAKGEDKHKDHKDVDDEAELECRFCDFTSESEKILRRHIRSQHAADARYVIRFIYQYIIIKISNRYHSWITAMNPYATPLRLRSPCLPSR